MCQLVSIFAVDSHLQRVTVFVSLSLPSFLHIFRCPSEHWRKSRFSLVWRISMAASASSAYSCKPCMISSARLSILVILSCLSGFCSKFQIILVQIIRCNTGDVVCDIPKQDSVACYRRHPVLTLPNEEFQCLCFFGYTSVCMLLIRVPISIKSHPFTVLYPSF